ncbi:glycoside hydrolase family 2 TIM barrel-domain containing protein [Paenibacillus sp. MMS20-IR301]|uniref:glycoside hydrolase family 2 protein n=1 Tax=Paenibacillus sp. MMS20-IR301 TaxID=2895946 RepID=UPI0028E64CBC|nr:glycoside hydrolase family 2 TIM barrel-domain containing protein [Paenibacillus sp. MMS20-IR301]WNS43111.1 glycoside hydrolase family 2 TIM barrel-domain containing protein [Paenibacillus sp. MMS20-IR301]
MEQLGRTIIRLDKTWRFQIDPEAEGITMGWDKTGLPSPEAVTVPHTWNVQPETENYRGHAWYELRCTVPELPPGGRVWFDFEAVYRDCIIWINGERAGSHLNSGYTSFRIEATGLLKARQENLLVISVDNGNSETALPKGNSFDWADDGGMIRGVTLNITGEAAIDVIQIEATPRFPDPEQPRACGRLRGSVTLHKALQTAAKEVRLELVLQQQGRTIWEGAQAAGYPCTVIPFPEAEIEGIELWHFDHPHLYELNVRIIADGELQDSLTRNIGFREFRAEGSRFLLNGEPVRLTGVEWMPGSHPDSGMAETLEDIKRVLTQMKQANCVFTRFHWQQSEQLLEWCDRYGILVQEEVPLWQQPAEPGAETLPLIKQQLSEMISRHNHHPSVIAWGVGNELDGQSPKTMQYVQEIRAYIKELDPVRTVNYVSNTVHLEPSLDATGAGDIIMWNDYIGTWHGEFDMDETVRKLIAAHPDKPIVVSEFGLCEPVYSGGDARRSEQMVEKMDIYRKVEQIAGMIYFNLNDYRTQMGEEGEGRMRQRVHGVTDLYGAEKPSYQLLREVSSPVTLEIVHQSSSDELLCRIKCSDGLPSYTIDGYKLILSAEEGSWERQIDIPVLSPGEQADLVVPAMDIPRSIRAAVRRPTGFDVLEQRVEL